MAQKVSIILIDDIDGSDATETITFGLDGTNYEIDLNDTHAAALREALAPYLGHGRKVGAAPRRRRAGAAAAADGPSAKEIRGWARGAGYDVPDRGRIPADVRAAYEAAH